MNDLELELRDLLTRRAGDVGSAPPMQRTLRRARFRRAVNAAVATLAVVAIATLSAAGIRELTRRDAPRPKPFPATTTEGEYELTSVEGTYPTVASGTFRGAEWELTATNTHENQVDTLHLALSLTEDGQTVTDEVDIGASDDFLLNRYVDGAEYMLDGAHVVYGVVISDIDSIEVEVADGTDLTIEPHFFRNYDSRSTITPDYFLAFVPDAPGFVAARDQLGIDRDLEPYGRVSLAPHVVATGKVPETGKNWSIEFGAVEKDRVCLVFSPEEGGSECLTREQIENAGPLLMVTFEFEDVLGVVAIISDEISHVRLVRDGGEPITLPWFQPLQEDRAEWPLRVVAVGLPPGAHGTLQGIGGDDGTLIAEERF